MLNKSGESWDLCLIPDLRGNAFKFLLSVMLVVGLSYVVFIMLRYGNSMPNFCSFLLLIDIELYKIFFCIYWDRYIYSV